MIDLRRITVFVAGLMIAAGICIAADQPNPTVAVTGGQIQGRLSSDIPGAVFRGIPFAQPPVGDLRWREPMPVKPWAGVRDADSSAPPCAQVNGGKWNETAAAQGKEDCLYLSIQTPEWPSKSLKPVMVWIHGGANMGGSVNDQEWPLSRYGVVTVKLRYRLGIFGFLVHPELSAESPHHVSGNYGILDQLAALRWVKENIAKFGGDPDNITVFGQSAGAYNVGYLLMSPLAKGLFHRAILQSGSAVDFDPLKPLPAAEKRGQEKIVGLKPPATGAIAYLRSLSTEEILKGATGSYWPDLDGYVLLRQPVGAYIAGQQYRVPMLIGTTAREFSSPATPEQLKEKIERSYGDLAPRALQVYRQVSTYPPYGNAAAQFATDWQFRCAAVATADLHSALAPVYQYEFSHTPPGDQGPSHSSELAYVFGRTAKEGMTDLDRQLSRMMQVYWTNFAKTGDPNGASVPTWPRYESTSKAYLEFTDDGPVVKKALRHEHCDVFAAYLNQWAGK